MTAEAGVLCLVGRMTRGSSKSYYEVRIALMLNPAEANGQPSEDLLSYRREWKPKTFWSKNVLATVRCDHDIDWMATTSNAFFRTQEG